MSLRDLTLDYWKKSQHLNALPSQEERERFALLVLTPLRDRADDPRRSRLMNKLIARVLQEPMTAVPA